MTNGAYVGQGSEFLVNTTVTGLQTDPTITALASGGFVCCWTDNSLLGGDSSGSSIKAQLYDASGAKLGGEFLVNTVTSGAQSAASVTSLLGGGFVVTWTDASSTGADPSQLGVKAQMYDASGAKVGGEFLVNTTTQLNQNASTITGLASGGFVVTWVDASGTNPDSKGTGVRAQIYNASGAKVGGEFLINSTITGSQNAPAITALASGGFAATWVDASGLGGDPTAPAVKAQVFSATGAKVGGEFLVNTTTAGSQDQPAIASLSTGGFVVVWRDTSLQGDTSASGVKAQIFDSTGAKVGGEFLVNTTTYNSQDQPVVTAIPGGGFAVSWRDNSNLAADPLGFGIKTQVFDNSGNKIGSEFQTNTTITGNQEMPTITALASGALVVGWTDSSGQGGDTDGGIKAQIFAPTAGTITDVNLSNTVISETAVENTTVASVAATGALNGAYSYQITNDSTGGGFFIDGNRLEVSNSLLLDYETAPTATITVRATDTFGNSFDKVLNLTIADSVVENRYVGREDLLANTVTSNAQQSSTITELSDGRYVLTWLDASGIGGDSSGSGIKGQIVDASGNKIGGEFLVNTQTLNGQDSPAVASLASGGFVVTWVDNSAVGADTSGAGIKAQMFDANGVATGSEFLVNTSTANAQKTPAIASLASGGFIVTWADSSLQGGDSSVSSVKAQLYDSSGARVGGEFLVNTNTANAQDTPVVASLTGGGFVISWHDSSLIGGDNSKDAVKAQIYDGSGNKVGSEFLVNTQTVSNQQQETITGLDNGGFVIAWADASNRGGDPDNYGIKMQIYDASGNKVGGETLVNSTTAGAQIAPNVTALVTGGFMVSWADYSGASAEGGTPGIKAQLFADDGSRVGGEFQVNTQTLGSQVDPASAPGADGGFAVTWTDYSAQGGDNSGTSVKFKVFDPLPPQGAPPPLITTADTLTGTEDTVAVFQAATLLANDTDSLGLPITLDSVTSVSGGSVVLDSNGNITFTPSLNFNGPALFSYKANDTAGNTATGHVTINVAPVNDPPTAFDDFVNVSQNGSAITTQTLTANDVDPDFGDKLTIQPLSSPTSALGVSLTLANGVITYAPGTQFQYLAAGQTLSDQFSYTIADQGGLTSSAIAHLTVVGVNDAPVNLTLSGSQVDENAPNGTVVGTVAATDPDQGDVLTYSLTNNAGGRFAIDPSTGIITVANGSLLDYETSPTQGIVAKATDVGGLSVSSAFTIGLNNLPEPKSWTGDNGVNVFTAPTNDLWTINGLGGNDTLTGNASADTLNGGAGNDVLNGAGGNNTLVGGTGDDTYFVNSSGDVVVENAGEGTDLVNSSVSYTLTNNVENLTLTGSADISGTGTSVGNTINGNSGNNTLSGGGGSDLINGNDGNDIVLGGDGADYLFGNNGNDTLSGGAGVDEMTGGAGADTFVFDSLTTSADRDKVKDFNPAEGDLFQFSKAVFAAFANTPLGALPASGFVNGGAATTADQHIIYQQSTGNLFYDPDGVGGQAQVQIAVLSTRPVLTAASFTLGA
jgi:Ca2+-binding RTX toxin-like protein